MNRCSRSTEATEGGREGGRETGKGVEACCGTCMWESRCQTGDTLVFPSAICSRCTSRRDSPLPPPPDRFSGSTPAIRPYGVISVRSATRVGYCFVRFPFLFSFFFFFFFVFRILNTQLEIFIRSESPPLFLSPFLYLSLITRLFVYHAESYYALLSRPGRGPNNAIERLTLFNARAHANRIHAGHASVRECVRA